MQRNYTVYAKYSTTTEKGLEQKDIFQILEETIVTESTTSDEVKQISHKKYAAAVRAPGSSTTIYQATTAKYIGKNEYKITFCVAGETFTRFVSTNAYDKCLYIKIDDIVPDAYVSFKRPEERIRNRNLIKYLDKTPLCKTKKQASGENSLLGTIKNKLGCTADEIRISSFIDSCNDVDNLFLPTYTGSLGKRINNDIALTINNNGEVVHITLENSYRISDSKSNNIVFLDQSGAPFMVVTCTPMIEKPEPMQTPPRKDHSYSFLLTYKTPIYISCIIVPLFLAYLIKTVFVPYSLK